MLVYRRLHPQKLPSFSNSSGIHRSSPHVVWIVTWWQIPRLFPAASDSASISDAGVGNLGCGDGWKLKTPTDFGPSLIVLIVNYPNWRYPSLIHKHHKHLNPPERQSWKVSSKFRTGLQTRCCFPKYQPLSQPSFPSCKRGSANKLVTILFSSGVYPPTVVDYDITISPSLGVKALSLHFYCYSQGALFIVPCCQGVNQTKPHKRFLQTNLFGCLNIHTFWFF